MIRIALVTALAILPACMVGHVGSGDAVTVDRDVEGATSFANETSLAVLVDAQAEQFEMSIRCDDNLMDELITEIDDRGELTLRTPNGVNLLPRTDCTAVLKLPVLESVMVSGSGEVLVNSAAPDLKTVRSAGSGSLIVVGAAPAVHDVTAHGSGAIELTGSRACEMAVEQTGSGRIVAGDLGVCDLRVRSSGSGSVTLSGNVQTLDLAVSGSGGMRDERLIAERADIDVSGSGNVELTVTHEVHATLSGSGSATIHGDPADRDVGTTGSGRIEFVD